MSLKGGGARGGPRGAHAIALVGGGRHQRHGLPVGGIRRDQGQGQVLVAFNG